MGNKDQWEAFAEFMKQRGEGEDGGEGAGGGLLGEDGGEGAGGGWSLSMWAEEVNLFEAANTILQTLLWIWFLLGNHFPSEASGLQMVAQRLVPAMMAMAFVALEEYSARWKKASEVMFGGAIVIFTIGTEWGYWLAIVMVLYNTSPFFEWVFRKLRYIREA